METFILVLMEKQDFGNLYAMVDNFFCICTSQDSQVRKKYSHYELRVTSAARECQKAKNCAFTFHMKLPRFMDLTKIFVFENFSEKIVVEVCRRKPNKKTSDCN